MKPKIKVPALYASAILFLIAGVILPIIFAELYLTIEGNLPLKQETLPYEAVNFFLYLIPMILGIFFANKYFKKCYIIENANKISKNATIMLGIFLFSMGMNEIADDYLLSKNILIMDVFNYIGIPLTIILFYFISKKYLTRIESENAESIDFRSLKKIFYIAVAGVLPVFILGGAMVGSFFEVKTNFDAKILKDSIAEIDEVIKPLENSLTPYDPSLDSRTEEKKNIEEQWNNAVLFSENVLKKYPNNAEIEWRIGNLYKLGYNLNKDGVFEKAEGYFKKSIEINPYIFEAHINLANLYVNSKIELAPQAEKEFYKALDTAKDNHQKSGAYSGLSFAYYYQDKIKEAYWALNKYLEIYPDDKAMSQMRDIDRDLYERKLVNDREVTQEGNTTITNEEYAIAEEKNEFRRDENGSRVACITKEESESFNPAPCMHLGDIKVGDELSSIENIFKNPSEITKNNNGTETRKYNLGIGTENNMKSYVSITSENNKITEIQVAGDKNDKTNKLNFSSILVGDSTRYFIKILGTPDGIKLPFDSAQNTIAYEFSTDTNSYSVEFEVKDETVTSIKISNKPVNKNFLR